MGVYIEKIPDKLDSIIEQWKKFYLEESNRRELSKSEYEFFRKFDKDYNELKTEELIALYC